jgi:hypothetical protein
MRAFAVVNYKSSYCIPYTQRQDRHTKKEQDIHQGNKPREIYNVADPVASLQS